MPSLLQFDKKTDAKVVEAKKKSYLQQNSSTFSQLVAEAKARRDSKKSARADLKSSCGDAGVSSSEDIEPGGDASENIERLKTGSVSLGVKRVAGDLSINLSASSEKRARSGGREKQCQPQAKK